MPHIMIQSAASLAALGLSVGVVAASASNLVAEPGPAAADLAPQATPVGAPELQEKPLPSHRVWIVNNTAQVHLRRTSYEWYQDVEGTEPPMFVRPGETAEWSARLTTYAHSAVYSGGSVNYVLIWGSDEIDNSPDRGFENNVLGRSHIGYTNASMAVRSDPGRFRELPFCEITGEQPANNQFSRTITFTDTAPGFLSFRGLCVILGAEEPETTPTATVGSITPGPATTPTVIGTPPAGTPTPGSATTPSNLTTPAAGTATPRAATATVAVTPASSAVPTPSTAPATRR